MAGTFDNAEIEWGQPGIPGTGLTEAEKTSILADLADLKARPTPPDTTTDLTDWSATAPAEGQFAIFTGGKWTPVTRPAITVPFAIPVLVDGGASAPATGLIGFVRPNFACTITGWTVNNDTAGSIEFDIWVAGSTIVGSTKPKTTSAKSASSTTMAGWTTTIAANTALEFRVLTASGITKSSFNLHLTRSI